MTQADEEICNSFGFVHARPPSGYIASISTEESGYVGAWGPGCDKRHALRPNTQPMGAASSIASQRPLASVLTQRTTHSV